jgi:hypothetical protein
LAAHVRLRARLALPTRSPSPISALLTATWRPVVWRLLLAIAIGLAVAVWAVFTSWGGTAVDAWAYWSFDPVAPYGMGTTPGPAGPGAYLFLYSPPAALTFIPFHALPFEAFVAMLRGAELAALVTFTGPFFPLAIVLPQVASEVNAANINLVLGAAIVLSFRWPALWVVVLLTKPSAALPGLLWLAMRDRRGPAIVVGLAGALSLASLLVAPGLWPAWLGLLLQLDNAGAWPIWYRLPIALAIAWLAARSDQRWLLLVASVIALPRLYFLSPAMLLAALPLVDRDGLMRLVRRLRDAAATAQMALLPRIVRPRHEHGGRSGRSV